MFRAGLRFSLPLLTTLVSACTTGPRLIRAYSGSELPPERLAVLELRAPEENGDGSCDDRHFRLQVDGSRYEQCRDILQLAPGPHVLRATPELFELSTFNPRVNGPMRNRAGSALVPSQAAELTLNLQAGRTYVFVHDRINTSRAQVLSIQVAIRRKDNPALLVVGTMKWLPGG